MNEEQYWSIHESESKDPLQTVQRPDNPAAFATTNLRWFDPLEIIFIEP